MRGLVSNKRETAEQPPSAINLVSRQNGKASSKTKELVKAEPQGFRVEV